MTSGNINGISGQIAGVSLSSFLQMIEMEQKTCTIKIFTKKNTGQIFFANGSLIDATTIHLKHLDAVLDILNWKNIVIEVDENDKKRQDLINLPLMHILMESARLVDENGDDTASDDQDKSKASPAKTIPLKMMKNKGFCLRTGIKLLIDFDSLDISFRSTLVGIEFGKYLLIKVPGQFSKTDQENFKKEDLIIKTLYRGTIYAFRSRMLAAVSNPSKLMFIEYPQKIEHHELRSHKRFKCNIVTQAEVAETKRDGIIENISEGGALCILETFPTDTNLAEDLLDDTIPFKCHFPGSKGEVGFLGEIRNSRIKPDEIVVGIKFVHPEKKDDVKNIIKNYIQLIEYSSENV